MAYFPFMIDMKDKDCLVVGGGRIACRKVSDLLRFGAHVTVVSIGICDEIRAMQDIRIIEKEYHTEDIFGRFLVIAATDQEDINRKIASQCEERQILVNAVDIKDACSFIFPAIIKKDDLVVGISTGGNSPAGAAFLKEKIEQSIPPYYEKNMEVLGKFRGRVSEEIADPALRKKLYYDLLRKADESGKLLCEKDICDYIAYCNKSF